MTADRSGDRIRIDIPDAPGLVLDSQRSRPSYFDGRFLTAADLTRDQDYMRRRQSDLARAAGSGVVAGLMVELASEETRKTRPGAALMIRAGHGITPGGELVMIDEDLVIDLADLPATRRLDARLGLRLEATEQIAGRQGLFVLALRPVEFTANPTTAYPTTLNGPRRTEDGDIVEATMVTLIPYPMPKGAASFAQARALVARDVFIDRASPGALEDALPLAMLALDRNTVRWLDVHMVRRETGADTPLQVGMGVRPRPLAEAHLLQHNSHFAEARALEGDFAASDIFTVLPPAGRLPLASIDIDSFGFLQSYFPAAVDADIAFVPSDELAALVEESLLLPPIDLSAPAADLDATAVIILMPVKRSLGLEIERLMRAGGLRARSKQIAAPKAFGLLASQRYADLAIEPAAMARALGPQGGQGLIVAETPDLAVWRDAWATARRNLADLRDDAPDLLWYVRRRTVPYRSRLEGIGTPLPQAGGATGDDTTSGGGATPVEPPEDLSQMPAKARIEAVVKRFGLEEEYKAYLESPLDNKARAAIDADLARNAYGPALVMAAIRLLRYVKFGFSRKAVRENHPALARWSSGLGFLRLDWPREPFNADILHKLDDTGLLIDLDTALFDARDEVQPELAEAIASAVAAADAGILQNLIARLKP